MRDIVIMADFILKNGLFYAKCQNKIKKYTDFIFGMEFVDRLVYNLKNYSYEKTNLY